MRVDIVLVVVIGVLVACGVSLVLERSLTRVLLGAILIGNGANLLIAMSGRRGGAPIAGVTPRQRMSDPLPQAMVLTAIVITLGFTAFLLALAYRTWQLAGHDEVQDDVEDQRIKRLAALGVDLTGGDETAGGTAEGVDLATLVLRAGQKKDTG